MAAMLKQVNAIQGRMWECKECHRLVPAIQTVAYHLVDRILYGWCETCFSNKTSASKSDRGKAN